MKTEKRKIWERTRSKNLSKHLDDSYIIKIIRNNATYNNVVPVITEETIQKKREELIIKRSLKESSSKICTKCKKDKDKRYFKNCKSIMCDKCKRREKYEKYGTVKYNKNIGVLQKKKFDSHREVLSDIYIKALIRSNIKCIRPLRNIDIPQEMIELKRKELLLKKQIYGNKT